MDLKLYGRVLRRFKFLVLIGLLLAIVLALLSFARVSFAGGKPALVYRSPITYESNETLLVSQSGFPEGRSTFPVTNPTTDTSTFADPSRFASLADFYAYLANSDAVTEAAARAVGHVSGTYVATPVYSAGGSSQTLEPVLQIRGLGATPEIAEQFARAGSAALRGYLNAQQTQAHIGSSERVLVTVLNAATNSTVFAGRKKTLPIVVFLAVIAATLALALMLENLRPQIRIVGASLDEHVPIRQQSTA